MEIKDVKELHLGAYGGIIKGRIENKVLYLEIPLEQEYGKGTTQRGGTTTKIVTAGKPVPIHPDIPYRLNLSLFKYDDVKKE